MQLRALRVSSVLSTAMLAVSSLAQVVAHDPGGALGRRYAELSGGRAEVGDPLFDDARAGGVAVNVPVAQHFDVWLGGGLSRTEGSTVPGMLASSLDIKSRRTSAYAGVTGYLRRGGVAPFLRVAAGYEQAKLEHRLAGGGPAGLSLLANFKESDTVWGAGAGAELTLGRVAFTAAADYRNLYRNIYAFDLGHAMTYSLTLHGWFTKVVGGFARASHIQPEHDFAEDTWRADIGVRIGF